MRSLIAGNWKMHGTLAESSARAGRLREHALGGLPCDVLICPPATVLGVLARSLRDCGILVGGQDCHAEAGGAFTGDIAAAMLADLGCSHVLVGHSERRRGHAETDGDVCRKAAAAHAAGLVAIVCLGEDRNARQAGLAYDVVRGQLRNSLPESVTAKNTIVAWEPVWAIGSGDTATPADAAPMHRAIRGELVDRFGGEGAAIRLLYGGSVNSGNAGQLLDIADVDGALVGGASLDPDGFWRIVRCGSPQ